MSWANGSKGVRANVEFFAGTPDAGKTIVHPMQISFVLGDFVGWGTYKGVGNSGCSTDNSGWNTYLDGRAWGTYFCRDSALPEYSDADDGTSFKIVKGVCGQFLAPGFDFYSGGSYRACENIDVESNPTLTVGGENPWEGPNQHINIRYYSLDRLKVSHSTWVSWNESNPPCEDWHYLIVENAADDIKAEEF